MNSKKAGIEVPLLDEEKQKAAIKGAAGAKAFEKAEDPSYAVKMGLKVDRLHYLRRQLMNPISDLLKNFVPDGGAALFASTIHAIERQQERQHTVDYVQCDDGSPHKRARADMSAFLAPPRQRPTAKGRRRSTGKGY